MVHGLQRVISFLIEHVNSTPLKDCLQNWYSHVPFLRAYRKSGTQDPGPLKWDPGPQYDQVGPGTLQVRSGTRDPKFSSETRVLGPLK